ncbi:hypothetical protein PoB_005630000 [Plakobranchus ocellatus]|uniref:Uncharacterized protein n=1 Tax=Plakobranchus ocellatus TaxID=259542 RepID=A0AAV4CDP9_9GAST|nr:hypothetical protein PoB_005630000 [Plakobranchus ocellatus]
MKHCRARTKKVEIDRENPKASSQVMPSNGGRKMMLMSLIDLSYKRVHILTGGVVAHLVGQLALATKSEVKGSNPSPGQVSSTLLLCVHSTLLLCPPSIKLVAGSLKTRRK